MEPEQPYRPPRADMSRRPTAGGGNSITPNMVQALLGTRPWVLLLGIVGMIGCAFMVLAGLAFIGLGNFPGMEEIGLIGGAAFGGVYLLMGFLYFFPSLYLIRYGGAIKRMGGRANPMAMEDALNHQRSFWRFVGIIMAVILIIYGIIFVIAILGVAVAPFLTG